MTKAVYGVLILSLSVWCIATPGFSKTKAKEKISDTCKQVMKPKDNEQRGAARLLSLKAKPLKLQKAEPRSDYTYLPFNELTLPLEKKVAWRRGDQDTLAILGQEVASFGTTDRSASISAVNLEFFVRRIISDGSLEQRYAAAIKDVLSSDVAAGCKGIKTESDRARQEARVALKLILLAPAGKVTDLFLSDNPLRILIRGKAGRSTGLVYLSTWKEHLAAFYAYVPPKESTAELERQATFITEGSGLNRQSQDWMRQLYVASPKKGSLDPMDQKAVSKVRSKVTGTSCRNNVCQMKLEGEVFNTDDVADVAVLDKMCRNEGRVNGCRTLIEAFKKDAEKVKDLEAWKKSSCLLGVKSHCEGYIAPAETSTVTTNTAPPKVVAVPAEPVPVDLPPLTEVDPVYFDKGVSELNEKAKAQLTNFAETFKQYPNAVMQLNGHTSKAEVENADSNATEASLTLGQNRVSVVKEYLVKLGIPGDRISVISYGEEGAAKTKKPEKQRRVEFQFSTN